MSAKQTLTIYQLAPPKGGGFHFGRQGIELEDSTLSFPSDSLYAALAATIAEQEGTTAVEAFLTDLKKQPPFRLTSVFPYVGRLPLLPMPRLRIKTEPNNDNKDPLPRKFSKKVKFVSPAIFDLLRKGETMNDYLEGGMKGRFLQDQAVWLTTEEVDDLPEIWLEPPKNTRGSRNEAKENLRSPETLNVRRVWNLDGVPRVTLDRVSSASTIFHIGRLTFNEGCGLWLGVEYHHESIRSRLEMLLHHLGDRGIGGERTAGYGAYILAGKSDSKEKNKQYPRTLPETLSFDAVDNGRQILLSRYYPKPTEMNTLTGDGASYHLVTAGGWLASPNGQALRRKQVNLIAEGSVVNGKVLGDFADVTPSKKRLQSLGIELPHQIYRIGLALSVSVTAEE